MRLKVVETMMTMKSHPLFLFELYFYAERPATHSLFLFHSPSLLSTFPSFFLFCSPLFSFFLPPLIFPSLTSPSPPLFSLSHFLLCLSCLSFSFSPCSCHLSSLHPSCSSWSPRLSPPSMAWCGVAQVPISVFTRHISRHGHKPPMSSSSLAPSLIRGRGGRRERERKRRMCKGGRVNKGKRVRK